MFDKENTLPFPPLPDGEGVVMLAGVKSEKGAVLQEIVEQLARRRRQLFGTMVRPRDTLGNFHNYLTINPGTTAFAISDLKLEKEGDKDVLIGKIKVLKTPYGKALSEMMERGMHLSIAPRTYRSRGNTPGSSDLRIVTWDVVSGEKK